MTHEERAERRKKIAIAASSGIQIDEVATRFGVTEKMVNVACLEHGVRPLRKTHVIKSESLTFKILYYILVECLSDVEIAQTLKCTKQLCNAIRQRASMAGFNCGNRTAVEP